MATYFDVIVCQAVYFQVTSVPYLFNSLYINLCLCTVQLTFSLEQLYQSFVYKFEAKNHESFALIIYLYQIK